ncbi:hypothetical protein C8J57DRAFT_1248484 [Mycena rebaudengoi]|nr:hypothetical protein C8J57DRAFT_1248484 [Mycena rebaudengoi]
MGVRARAEVRTQAMRDACVANPDAEFPSTGMSRGQSPHSRPGHLVALQLAKTMPAVASRDPNALRRQPAEKIPPPKLPRVGKERRTHRSQAAPQEGTRPRKAVKNGNLCAARIAPHRATTPGRHQAFAPCEERRGAAVIPGVPEEAQKGHVGSQAGVSWPYIAPGSREDVARSLTRLAYLARVPSPSKCRLARLDVKHAASTSSIAWSSREANIARRVNLPISEQRLGRIYNKRRRGAGRKLRQLPVAPQPYMVRAAP